MECKDFEPSIIQDKNDNNKYINIKDVAEAKGLTSTRSIRLELNKVESKYISREIKVNGGTSYEILFSSLEPEIQQKLREAENKTTALVPHNYKEPDFISDKTKLTANYRANIVVALQKLRKKYPTKKEADTTFLELYNSGLYLPKAYSFIGSISIGTLHRWVRAFEKHESTECLQPKYKWSKQGEYNSILNNEMRNILLTLLLHPSKYNYGKAIKLTKEILRKRGYEELPCDLSFKRFAENFRKNNYAEWILRREGMKAYHDKVEPYIERDISKIEVGDILVADGHVLNFQVINPFTGRPTRATLVGFLDWKSTALVGYDIMLEENTQNIANALRNAILNMDKVPEYVYQDNGRAFKSKFFNGDSKFEELGFTGVYQKLGITPVYAMPYNARAKVIERFFLDFQESFEKLMPSYIGTSIDNKPAYMNRNEKLHKQIHSQKANFIPTIEQALILIKEWLKFKHSQPCPNNRNKTIAQMLATIQKQNIDESQLDDLMMDTVVKHIGRNGIRFLKADYFNDALYGIRGKCVVKYNLNDLSYIKIYSMKGEFLCRADRVTATHPLAHLLGDVKDIEDYKQKIRKQKQLQNKTIKAVKEHFSLEDIDLIKSKLIEAEISKEELIIEQPVIEKQEVKKEKTKQPETYVQNRKRPIFKDNYERYEWHMKNGCIGNEDRQWLSEYIRSEEFKIIYEK